MASYSEIGNFRYSCRQRAVCLSLGIASSIPMTTAAAIAHAPAPSPFPSGPANAWQSHQIGAAATHGVSSTGSNSVGALSSRSSTLVHTSFVPLVHNAALTVPISSGAALNLASASLSFLAGNLAGFKNLTIDVGGKQEQVSLNTKLTAAEVVAAEQVLSGGGQTIKLSAGGVGNGGTISLNGNLLSALDSSVGGSLTSLTVAKGVQVVDSLNLLSLAGGLTNYGSILTAAASSGSSDTISAGSIRNASGASIGSYSGGGDLVGADPILNAVTSITNNGTISSAGNLTISAPVVYNVASHGSAASINAAQNVNINTASLTNSGSIAAALGNVNVASTQALNLTGSGGTIEASNGNINVSSTGGDITANGGNYLSQQVNFNSGTNNVTAQMDQVSGVVNASGNCVHIYGNSSALDLGNITASGDPTITNTGDLQISGTMAVANGDLTLIAGGNIVSETGNMGIDTSGAVAPLGQINLIAGAAFTPNVSANPATASVTVTKGSTTGGIIDLTGGSGGSAPITKIDSNGSADGSILMVAYAGKDVGSGSVETPASVPINAGTNGAVTIIAGAKTGTAISTGAISGGSVLLSTSTPTITAAKGTKGVVFDTTGALSSGSFNASKTPNAANITVGDVQSPLGLSISTGGTATVVNGGDDLLLSTVTVGKTGSLIGSTTGTGNITVTGVITGGTTSLTTYGNGTLLFSGSGTINTTSASLTSGDTNSAANNLAITDVTNLTTSTAGSSFTISQEGASATKPALTLNLVSNQINGAGNFTLTSTGQINESGLLKIGTGNVSLTSKGLVNLTGSITAGGGNILLSSTSTGGINIAAPQFLGNGQITLNNSGTGKISQSAGLTLTDNTIIVNSATNVATKTAAFSTNANTLDINAIGAKSSKVVIYDADQNGGAVTLSGNGPTAGAAIGGSLFVTSVSNALTVTDANYATVSLTDTASAPADKGVILAGASPLGTGAGTFTVVSGSAIAGAGTVQGTTVTLTGATGVGTKATNITANSPILALTSANGSVWVTDGTAATVTGSSSLNAATSFNVTDTGTANAKTGASLTVGKSIAGGNINLTTSGAGSGTIAANGLVGTTNTNSVTLDTKNSGLTTKGAISGANITLEAEGGNLTVGGAVGGLGSNVLLETTGASPTPNLLTVGGVVSGATIAVQSTGQVITTKAITGSGAGSTVTIEGTATSATGNAITIGGAVGGANITIGSGAAVGATVINAGVGTLAGSESVTIFGGTVGTAGSGQITGKGLIAGQTVGLSSATNIGAAKTPMSTEAVLLNINSGGVNDSPAFVTQKGNLVLGAVNSSNFVMKVTGALNINGAVTVPTLSLTSTGATTISGDINDGGTAGTLSITAVGLTTNGSSSIVGSTTTVANINVTGVATINGSVAVPTLNLTTSGALNIGGTVNDKADNITSKGGINLTGTLGSATDALKVSTTGAFIIGFPDQTAGTLQGNNTSTVTALTFTNFGTASGGITYNATGTGNAFSNYGTLGAAGDTYTVNATKGTIFSGVNSVVNGAAITLNALSTNMTFSGNADITGGTIKNAMVIAFTGSGAFAVGGTSAAPLAVGSANVSYTDANNINNDPFLIASVAASSGDLTFSGNARHLQVEANNNLTTTAGNITLQNTDVGNAADVTLQNSVTIHASGAASNLNQGNVFIFTGGSFTPAPGVAPATGLTIAGTTPGQVTFGSTANTSGTITIGASGNTATSSGRNLAFNEGTSGTTIGLGGNDSITADPPAGASAAPALNVAVISAPAISASAISSPNVGVVSNAQTVPAGLGNTSGLLSALTSGNGSALNAGIASGLNSTQFANSSGVKIDGNSTASAGLSDLTIESLTGQIGGKLPAGEGAPIAERKLSGGVSNISHRTLEQGPLLLAPEQDQVVETPLGAVKVSAGAVVLIVMSDKGLAVYNLHDSHNNAVAIDDGSAVVSISPGRSAVLTSQTTKSFEDVNPAPFVSYRRLGSRDGSGQTKIYQADFDMMSMMRGLPALQNMVSSDNAATRKSMNHMLKTMAILTQVGQSNEPYALYLTPSLTARALTASR